jgi:hypothetical protein
MIIWEIVSCEEYEWQHPHGLYADREHAIEVAKNLCSSSWHSGTGENTPVSVVELPNEDIVYVLAGVWTSKEFAAWRELENNRYCYWWFRKPFNHQGAWGVWPRKVIE